MSIPQYITAPQPTTFTEPSFQQHIVPTSPDSASLSRQKSINSFRSESDPLQLSAPSTYSGAATTVLSPPQSSASLNDGTESSLRSIQRVTPAQLAAPRAMSVSQPRPLLEKFYSTESDFIRRVAPTPGSTSGFRITTNMHSGPADFLHSTESSSSKKPMAPPPVPQNVLAEKLRPLATSSRRAAAEIPTDIDLRVATLAELAKVEEITAYSYLILEDILWFKGHHIYIYADTVANAYEHTELKRAIGEALQLAKQKYARLRHQSGPYATLALPITPAESDDLTQKVPELSLFKLFADICNLAPRSRSKYARSHAGTGESRNLEVLFAIFLRRRRRTRRRNF